LVNIAVIGSCSVFFDELVGTVENHGKNGKKTLYTFVKIAKITAFYIDANLLKHMVSNSRKNI